MSFEEVREILGKYSILDAKSVGSKGLRIDNGGLEYMCIWFYIFSDILAMHQSIWT